ncbi:hypothetical protein OIU85_007496 [Salix viminalis]|uniref:Histone H2A n=1 Tax=Salix viminalis TaxID=40686 RepID=A0A9Q0SNS3_SALVM|nr:hypothetical protein OIU85_007496 [Salix viminalis]KAJ6683805.1 hypothetical protein OIU85_007496 [Salix viminalis]
MSSKERGASTMGGRGKPKASKSVSRSQQAGLQFPVGKIARFLKAGKYAERVGAGDPVYLSAVLEYLAAELQLNYLAVASDPGKVFGWSSGLALMYLPQWVVLFMAAIMGFFGYGLQWLVIRNTISLPYILVCPLFFFI